MLAMLKSFAGYKYAKQLIIRYIDDDLAEMSAQTTYYLILAFFPFLFFLINLLSFTPLSNRVFIANFTVILPAETASIIKNVLIQTVQAKSTTLLLFGMLTSLWAASRGMMSIIRGLNHSYGVKETRHFLQLNTIAIASTIGLSVMMVLSLFMIVFGRIIGSYIFGLVGAKTLFYSLWAYFRYGISLALMIATFFILYRYLPNKRLKARSIILGTAFTTIGWISASMAFSLYINRFANYELIYGSLGGIFALIIWLYISTLIFLLGGGINAISSNLDNEHKPPD